MIEKFWDFMETFCKLILVLMLFFWIGVFVVMLFNFKAYASNTPAMLKGIHKESCWLAHVVQHQKEVLHRFAEQGGKFSDEDNLRIRFATSTIASEQNRMTILGSRFSKLTGRELTWEGCP